MKAILISIKPKYVANILNEIKTLEIRKRFPSDYVGWVYIYCTKDKYSKLCYFEDFGYRNTMVNHIHKKTSLNGKVVARFWCDRVEEITPSTTDNFTKDSCLTIQELENYLWSNILFGYAIHITKLEIFDKPKEISEFKSCLLGHNNCVPHNCRECPATKSLTRAPQSWCYIEV